MTGGVASEPLVRPPRLDVQRAGTASRLELFFDLAYVLVVLELAKGLYANLTWSGLAVAVGLFVTIWFSWVGFTLYANRFDTDDVVFRVAKLAATATIAGCAASASDAVGKYAVPFAACYLASRIILFLLYVRAWRHVLDARPTIAVYLATVGVSALLWAVSLAVPAPGRYWLWAVAVLVSAAGPLLATLRSTKLPLQIEHLPERFALLVILVLGEAVGGAARGAHDAAWAPVSVVIAGLAFLTAAGLWWIYFDITARSSERELEKAEEEAEDEAENEAENEAAKQKAESGSADEHTQQATNEPATDERHDLFIYGHLPLTLGIVLAGVGLEDLIVHPEEGAPSPGAWLFAAGLALFLIGVSLVIAGTAHTLRAIWPWPVAAVPVVLVGALVPFTGSLLLVGVYTLGVLILAVHGTAASRRTDTALAGTDN